MQEQFLRTQMLLGTQALERLRKARVAVFGGGGMLLGVPLAAAAYRILRDDVNSRLAAPETEN